MDGELIVTTEEGELGSSILLIFSEIVFLFFDSSVVDGKIASATCRFVRLDSLNIILIMIN